MTTVLTSKIFQTLTIHFHVYCSDRENINQIQLQLMQYFATIICSNIFFRLFLIALSKSAPLTSELLAKFGR